MYSINALKNNLLGYNYYKNKEKIDTINAILYNNFDDFDKYDVCYDLSWIKNHYTIFFTLKAFRIVLKNKENKIYLGGYYSTWLRKNPTINLKYFELEEIV